MKTSTIKSMVTKPFMTVKRAIKNSKTKKEVQRQVKTLEIQSSLEKQTKTNKRNLEYYYIYKLPKPVISEKAQDSVNKINDMLAEQAYHDLNIELLVGNRMHRRNDSVPRFTLKRQYQDGTRVEINKHDGLEPTQTTNFHFFDKDNVEQETIRISNIDNTDELGDMGWKKGQLVEYKNSKTRFYKKDILYPKRRFDTIEQQTQGHPLIMKRVNQLLSRLFDKQ